MRRLGALLGVAFAVAGCGGGHTYSDAEVQRAFSGLLRQSQNYAPTPTLRQFATLTAITGLRFDEGLATPAEAYLGNGFEVLRFRSAGDAAVGAQGYEALKLKLAFPTAATVRRAGNVLLVSQTTIPAANDALSRLG